MKQFASIALVFLVACSGSDPKTLNDEGNAALGKGDAKSALSKFDAALAGLDPAHEQYVRAALGRCEALAKTDGPAAAKSFLTLADRAPTKVMEDDYRIVCGALSRGGFPLDALEVSDAGIKRFPTSEKMKMTHEAILHAAKSEKTPDALKKLESLGYAGK